MMRIARGSSVLDANQNPTNSRCTAGGNVPERIFVGGTIPDACISSVAKSYSEALPQPNAGGENLLPSLAKSDSKAVHRAHRSLLRKQTRSSADTLRQQ